MVVSVIVFVSVAQDFLRDLERGGEISSATSIACPAGITSIPLTFLELAATLSSLIRVLISTPSGVLQQITELKNKKQKTIDSINTDYENN